MQVILKLKAGCSQSHSLCFSQWIYHPIGILGSLVSWCGFSPLWYWYDTYAGIYLATLPSSQNFRVIKKLPSGKPERWPSLPPCPNAQKYSRKIHSNKPVRTIFYDFLGVIFSSSSHLPRWQHAKKDRVKISFRTRIYDLGDLPFVASSSDENVQSYWVQVEAGKNS